MSITNINISDKIFQINSDYDFNLCADFIFQHQIKNNRTFAKYYNLVKKNISSYCFLPIEFYKTHKILSSKNDVIKIFESSGTSNTLFKSKHYITDLEIYKKSAKFCFEQFFSEIKNIPFLALLPGYLERDNSSLVYMLKYFMQESNSEYNGFYLNQFEKLNKIITFLEAKNQKYYLWGVTHALLNFSSQYKPKIKHGTIIETGGMKGKNKEITRNELYSILKKSFNTREIASEYGMTELFTQAYSKDNGRYYCPNWMKVFVRDTNDPFYIKTKGTGAINIIDLSNYNSCSFIETSDLGKIYPDGSFEILGRYDKSEARGCNLMTI